MSANDHNGYFGLNAAHVAEMTDVEALTYATPVNIGELGGIIEIALDPDTATDPVYATDRIWIDAQVDNGFTGTMRLVNIWGHPVLRPLFAKFCGYTIASDGTLLGTSDVAPVPFALMGSTSGNLEDKRCCYLKVQAGKPSRKTQTKEGGVNNLPDEIPITARPVVLPDGTKTSFYENVPADGDLFDDFFEAVRLGSSDCNLNALVVGTLRLTPNFDPAITEYTASTSSSSVAVTAITSDEDATVVLKNGTTAVTNGGSASLSTGTNTITATVSNGTSDEKKYTVVVTKTA